MKKRIAKILLIIFIAVLFISQTKVTTLRDTEKTIYFDKKSGFFNIYIEDSKVYGLSNSEELSSKFLIKFDSTIFDISEMSADKRELIEEGNDYIKYKWDGSFLSIEETIKFVSIDDLNSGVQVEYKIVNKDKRGHFINLGLAFDTYLGESTQIPFRVSNIGIIKKETVFKRTSIPEIVYSLDDATDPKTGLLFFIRKTGFDIPEKIILSNYEKLISNLFNFSEDSTSNFDSKYKRNDAALGYLFGEKYVESDNSYTVKILLGIYPQKLETKETNEFDNVDKRSDYLKKYTEEQIEKLNEELNKLKEIVNSIYDDIDDIKLLDEILLELQSINKEIEDLITNYVEMDKESFDNQVNMISKKIENLKNKLLNN